MYSIRSPPLMLICRQNCNADSYDPDAVVEMLPWSKINKDENVHRFALSAIRERERDQWPTLEMKYLRIHNITIHIDQNRLKKKVWPKIVANANLKSFYYELISDGDPLILRKQILQSTWFYINFGQFQKYLKLLFSSQEI